MHEAYRTTASARQCEDLVLVEGWADLTRYVAMSRNRSLSVRPASERAPRLRAD